MTVDYLAMLHSTKHSPADAARLLLILDEFAVVDELVPERVRKLLNVGSESVRSFSPEYYLQKLDFLLRYPRYLAFEIVDEAVRLGDARRIEAMSDVRGIVFLPPSQSCPEPFMRFKWGAYEHLTHVEMLWLTYRLVLASREPATSRQKTFYITERGRERADALRRQIDAAREYSGRIRMIKKYLGSISASEIRTRQYRHQAYKDVEWHEPIPNLTEAIVKDHFRNTFNEEL